MSLKKELRELLEKYYASIVFSSNGGGERMEIIENSTDKVVWSIAGDCITHHNLKDK